MASSSSTVSAERPDTKDIEEFIHLFDAHLAQSIESNEDNVGLVDPSSELELFQARIPSNQKEYFDRLANQRRQRFHSDQTQTRQTELHSLLVQLPPFTISQQDQIQLKSLKSRYQRIRKFQSFIRQFTTQSDIGTRPFFAALKRVLEAQSKDRFGKRVQWILDDAVLMETGGKEFMRSAVLTLKGVLHFTESKNVDTDLNPFNDLTSSINTTNDPKGVENVDVYRIWTIPSHLTNLECASLARCIPSHVLPKRGRGSQPVHVNGQLDRIAHNDEERQNISTLDLPTGSLRYAPISVSPRDQDYRGGWLEWIFYRLFAFVSFL